MNRFIFSSLFVLSGLTLKAAAAANLAPVIKTPLADQTVFRAAGASIDLADAFSDPDTKAVRFSTVLGDFDVALFSQAKPITVTNFFHYLDEGRYFKIDPTTHHRASVFFHRSVPDFVIQGGGFIGTVNPSNPTIALPTQVVTFPPIVNEPGISNKRGTIAMAKLSGNANSATSQWFINLADNGGPPNKLDTNESGYTVFGRVVGNGMNVVDQIAMVPGFNLPPFDSIPLRNFNNVDPVKVENLVSIPGLIEIPPFTFTASSSDATIATVSVNPNGRQLAVSGKQIGTTTITVTATDYDGASVSQHFDVDVVAAPGRLANISTRLQVGADPNALIGGFILTGASPKRVLIRAIGPSLSQSGVMNSLADPILELHDNTKLLATSDDFGDSTNRQAIIDTGIAPTSSSEAAILMTLPAKNASYTAIVRGVNNTTGVGLVEVYDLDYAPGSTIANISTRGLVQTGDQVMIGGFILGGTSATNVLVRAIGPSLSAAGITNPLADPKLELHNAQGTKIAENNDWQISANDVDIQATGIAPTNPHESAILQALPPGAFTAIVSGAGTRPAGVALVEVYQLP